MLLERAADRMELHADYNEFTRCMFDIAAEECGAAGMLRYYLNILDTHVYWKDGAKPDNAGEIEEKFLSLTGYSIEE